MSKSSEQSYVELQRALAQECPIAVGSRVGLAVSGGADSVALATLFADLVRRARRDLELLILHVHHGLRSAADDDARFVAELANDLGVPCVSTDVDVQGHAKQHRISVETAGRQLRLRCFEEAIVEHRLWGVATAHHADDQVETILGNVLRGSGLRGMRGMPWQRPLCSGILARPLLGCWGTQLKEWLCSRKRSWREDESNRSREFRRNRLRIDILPHLDSDNPKWRQHILALAQDAQQWHQWQQQQLSDLPDLCQHHAQVTLIAREPVAALPAPLRQAYLDQLWARCHGRPRLIRDHHRAWNSLLDSSPGSHYDLPDNWVLERAASWLYLHRLDLPAWEQGSAFERQPLESWGLHCIRREAATHRIPAPALRRGRFRRVRKGDQISFKGGHQSVVELLRHAGLPRALREQFPVFEFEQEVLWIPGLRCAPTAAGDDVGVALEATGGDLAPAWLLAQLPSFAVRTHPA